MFIGSYSGYYATTSLECSGVGYASLFNLTTGTYNVGIGHQAIRTGTTFDENTALGHSAGYSVTGDKNTLIGRKAGYSGTNDLTSGDNNILIGYQAAASSATVSNEITLGDANITTLRVPGLDFSIDSTGALVTSGSNLGLYNTSQNGTKRGFKINSVGSLEPWNGNEVDVGVNGAYVREFKGVTYTGITGNFSGTVTANAFAGDGSNLTGVGAANGVFYENSQTLSSNYTVPNGSNAMAAGPITIASGVTVTVGSGETLTIV